MSRLWYLKAERECAPERTEHRGGDWRVYVGMRPLRSIETLRPPLVALAAELSVAMITYIK